MASKIIGISYLIELKPTIVKRRKKGLKGAELQTALKGLVFKPPGKKTLVPVSDPRTEAQDVMEAVFGPTTINRETAIQSTEDL